MLEFWDNCTFKKNANVQVQKNQIITFERAQANADDEKEKIHTAQGFHIAILFKIK